MRDVRATRDITTIQEDDFFELHNQLYVVNRINIDWDENPCNIRVFRCEKNGLIETQTTREFFSTEYLQKHGAKLKTRENYPELYL